MNMRIIHFLIFFLVPVFGFQFTAQAIDSCNKAEEYFVSHSSVLAKNSVDFLWASKSMRQLRVYSKGQLLKVYRISVGSEPGKKQMRDDFKTPEGLYKIEYKNPKSQFYKSLFINYPNADDLRTARQLGVDPGGEIFLHGFPNDPSEFERSYANHLEDANWTMGCLAVTNEEMDELFTIVKVGATIRICP
jgi:murein L,D-transpeptidase YafK